MLITPQKPLSFGDYKTRMKTLESEQLELVKALAETTENVEKALDIIAILRTKLTQFMSEKEIDEMVSNWLEDRKNAPKIG